ncbi:ribosome maturation factor RimM [Phaeocystidibacter luteus]|uniref:Ribosome maturation factor RimM n=1 Tax=Phaeocystidibacter luteus TaxID=911197 RepID=A0A6N6RK27_9FLAO|nr:ribosome maturation factor RimM [Phaeocystidibacter luteus]KAB2814235.1 16S rRNA processing protein RimM [Phaeocystidibacter luteus]
MRTEDCFVLGTITRQHGYKGDVVAKIDTDRPDYYQNLESVLLLEGGGLIPFFITHAQLLKKDQLLLRFEEVKSGREAEALMGRELFLPLSSLPPLEGKNFYFHEIAGFQVHANGHLIGTVKDVIDRPGQPVLQVEEGEAEILIPMVDEFIEKIDRSEGCLYLQVPDGLVDLYR